MHENNFLQVRSFARTLVAQIDAASTVGASTRIGVITYSNEIIERVRLSQNLAQLEVDSLIEESVYQGSITRMHQALEAASDQFNDPTDVRYNDDTVSRSVVLFTDGYPHDDKNPIRESNSTVLRYIQTEFLDKEIFVYVLGVHRVNDAFVNHVSMQQFGGGGLIDTFDELGQFPSQVMQALDISCEPPRGTYS